MKIPRQHHLTLRTPNRDAPGSISTKYFTVTDLITTANCYWTSYLRYLACIYEERSISATAKRFIAAQSSLSKQIKEPEDRLGIKLFERSSSGVTPTAAGEKLYRGVSRILREVDAIQNDLSVKSDEPSGTIKIGIMPTFARAVIGAGA